MRQIDNEYLSNIRYPGRPDSEAGIVHPTTPANSFFHGWGPRLVAGAVAAGALAFASCPAKATTEITTPLACSNPDHGATLLSNPDVEDPAGVAASGQTIVRVSLAPTGRVSGVSIMQSSGNFDLDFAAARVAEQSRYAPASAGCRAAADTFLYTVTFAE